MARDPSPLRQARMDIETFMDTLDNTMVSCPCCEHPKYVNWEDHKAYEALLAITIKLKRTEDHYR